VDKEVDAVPDLKLGERDIELLAPELEQIMANYGLLFRHREQREAASFYLEGLLSQLPRTSVEPIALSLLGPEETKVRVLQQFVSIGAWDDRPMLERHWEEVDRMLGEDDGVHIIDFPKQGTTSVGVKRQPCGQLGKRANCQAGVFPAYASRRGYTLLDRRLYMPEDWLTSSEFAVRRSACGVPQDLAFKTKPQLGAEMAEAVGAAGALHCRWVVMDEAFGHDTALLHRIWQAGQWYLAEV
jgi:SRSO17 transposase